MQNQPSVLIIGGGVIGVCSAYFLSKKGYRVTLIEKNEVGNGSSFGNAGLISPSHFIPLAAPGVLSKGLKWMLDPGSPFYIKPRLNSDLIKWLLRFRASCNSSHVNRAAPVLRDLCNESMKLFEHFDRTEKLDFSLAKKGLMMLCRTEKALKEESAMAEKAREIGIEAQVLDTDQINRLDPNMKTTARGGIFFPGDGHFIPDQFVKRLNVWLQNNGVRVLEDTSAIRFDSEGRKIKSVETEHDHLSADEYVIAGGAWSTEMAKELGINLLMQAGKGYSITVEDPERQIEIPTICVEARVAITPMGQALRFAGTMELAGVQLRINQRRVNAILNAVPKYLKGFTSIPKTNVWAGLRPVSPDGLPYIGRFSAYDNLTIASGHAMLGMTLGPITGKLVSEILSNEEPSIELKLLDPNRFN